MATNTKKKEDIKKEESIENQPELLTEEEFARRQRKKNKERVNKIIRLVGLIGTFILFYGAIFDILFELSYFGWMWYAIKGIPLEENPHNLVWDCMKTLPGTDIRIYDVKFFGEEAAWLPKTGMTMLLIASIVVVLYLTIYCIIDLIEFIRAFIKFVKDVSGDLEATANDGGFSLKRKPAPEPEPFVPTKKPQPRRRKDTSTLDGMSDEDLDKILRGEKIVDGKLEKEVSNTKDLFSDDEE